MSMLSAQIDELRNAAEFYDGFKAANLMRDAADTIWELRGALQVASVDYRHLADENAKLRDLMYDRAHDHAIQHMTEDELRITAANALEENAKLRELVHWMYDRMDESCAVQHPYSPMSINYDQLMQAQARACELGVEVE